MKEDKYKEKSDYHWRLYYSKKPNLYQKHVDRVANFFKDKKGKFLDVGCGDALILSRLNKNKKLNCFGIDTSATAIRIAKQKGITNCQLISLFGFEGSNYDYIFLGDVLEHLPDPEKGLRKVKELLKPKGVVFIAIPIQKKKSKYDFHLFAKNSAFKLIGKFFKIQYFEQINKKIYFISKRENEEKTK